MLRSPLWSEGLDQESAIYEETLSPHADRGGRVEEINHAKATGDGLLGRSAGPRIFPGRITLVPSDRAVIFANVIAVVQKEHWLST